MGDYDFDGANYLDDSENIIWWAIWLIMVVVCSIIFLNFVIAEASASYEKVKGNLNAQILKERACLIQEAENMIPVRFITTKISPQYIVIR